MPKQRYWLVFHSRPNESLSIQEKHAHFFAGTAGLTESWGIGSRPVPELRFKGAWPSALNLKPYFGQGVHRAMLVYSFRRGPSSDGHDDDLLNITFDPSKVDVGYLIAKVIPTFIKAFDAYLVEYFDEAMIETAAEELRGLPVNPRRYVHRVGLVSFFDEQLCRVAFNLSPPEVLVRVEGKAERAELLHGGTYIIGAGTPLSFDDAQAKCRELIAAVRKPPEVSSA